MKVVHLTPDQFVAFKARLTKGAFTCYASDRLRVVTVEDVVRSFAGKGMPASELYVYEKPEQTVFYVR